MQIRRPHRVYLFELSKQDFNSIQVLLGQKKIIV